MSKPRSESHDPLIEALQTAASKPVAGIEAAIRDVPERKAAIIAAMERGVTDHAITGMLQGLGYRVSKEGVKAWRGRNVPPPTIR